MTEVSRIVFVDVNKAMFNSRDAQIEAVMKQLWQHSLGAAFAAGMLSNNLDFGVMQHEAFSAGLFHDPSLTLLRTPEAIKLRLTSSELDSVQKFLTTSSLLSSPCRRPGQSAPPSAPYCQ